MSPLDGRRELAARAVWAGASIGALLLGCRTAPPPFEEPVLRGHQEVELQEDGAPLPLIFAGLEAIALCFQVDPTRDTSRFELRSSFHGRASPDGFVPPRVRSGETLCFDATLPDGLPDGRIRVCGRLIDRYDQREYRVPCQTLLHRRDRAALRALAAEREALLARAFELDFANLLESLDELAARAGAAGLPAMRVQIELIAIHFLTLEGKAASRREARQRLEALPGWIEEPAALTLGAMAAYQSAVLHFDSGGRLKDAWVDLSKADELYRRVADPKRFTVTMEVASILHQLGAMDEAIQRLRGALAECEYLPCDPGLLQVGRNNLAWFIALHPNAREEELTEAEKLLQGAMERTSFAAAPLEHANFVINLAYLAVRQGESPASLLEETRRALADLRLDTERQRYLLDWAELVSGHAALAEGFLEDAVERCGGLIERRESRLAAWAFSCMARAFRRLGDLEAAASAIEQALLRHAYGASQPVTRTMIVGPGYRAEEFARAARIAIERGQPEIAWELLLELDRFSTGERARQRCRDAATGAELERWLKNEAELERILGALQDLESPAAPRRRFEQEQLRRDLKLRLKSLWGEWPGCEAGPSAEVEDQGVDYRAFALEDEVILLHRRPGGAVEVEKRTPMLRRNLTRRLDVIGEALGRREIDDAAWRQLLGPIAEALLPRVTESLGPVTVYALHGLLQNAPLVMLPIRASPRARWLGEATAVALQPVGSRAAPRLASRASRPLFVVDPRHDLPAAPRLITAYRELFPRARFLTGDEATLDAFRQHAPRTDWLHVDAHGIYDPAFPELSALQLADRPLHWVQLAEMSMPFRFAHLSGCQTGRWPITADSGSYGIAGLVTRLGVGWAIASRNDLDDRVAEDFNRAFYDRIAAGHPVPAAYRHALRRVIDLHPAGSWGGLLLLSAAGSR